MAKRLCDDEGRTTPNESEYVCARSVVHFYALKNWDTVDAAQTPELPKIEIDELLSG